MDDNNIYYPPDDCQGKVLKDKALSDVALATGGLLHMCGWPDLPPQRMAGSQAYYMASLQAATGTLLALYHRLHTGKGQHVDTS